MVLLMFLRSLKKISDHVRHNGLFFIDFMTEDRASESCMVYALVQPRGDPYT